MGLILLVRHAQASWGSADYDQLSDLGHRQCAELGAHLARTGVRPTRLVGGSLRRHRQTAEAVGSAAGWESELLVDPGWDEYDHVQLLETYGAVRGVPEVPQGRAELDRWIDAAVARWAGGEHDSDYPVTFAAFRTAVAASMAWAVADVGSGETVVVLTSGGPIAWVVASLLGGEVDAWSRLHPVTVNTAVSKVTVGSRGRTLVSFNEHGHLPTALLTYR